MLAGLRAAQNHEKETSPAADVEISTTNNDLYKIDFVANLSNECMSTTARCMLFQAAVGRRKMVDSDMCSLSAILLERT